VKDALESAGFEQPPYDRFELDVPLPEWAISECSCMEVAQQAGISIHGTE